MSQNRPRSRQGRVAGTAAPGTGRAVALTGRRRDPVRPRAPVGETKLRVEIYRKDPMKIIFSNQIFMPRVHVPIQRLV